MSVKVSVCVFTCRPGGIDVLLTGLQEQEFTDFEVVLVDGLRGRRENVSDAFLDARVRLTYVPPRYPTLPYDSIPAACNAAIRAARGDLLVWFVDYTWLPPACLHRHWERSLERDPRFAGVGACIYVSPPPTSFDLPWYAPAKFFGPDHVGVSGCSYEYVEDASLAYVEDIGAGFYSKYWYSIFRQPIEHGDQVLELEEDELFFGADRRRQRLDRDVINADEFYFKNDSMSLFHACIANGVDETFLSHVQCDTDFGCRTAQRGAQWSKLPDDSLARIVNPRHIFPHLLWRKGLDYDVAQRDMSRLAWSKGLLTYDRNPYKLDDVRAMGPSWWS